MPIDRTCQHCGKIFTVGLKEAHKNFCSRTCYFEERKTLGNAFKRATPTETTCRNCGARIELKGRNYNVKYCSDNCREAYTAANGKHGQLTALSCAHCAKEFKATPKQIRQGRKYCSMACYTADLVEHGRPESVVEAIEFACHTCDKPFFRKPGELREYHAKFGKDPLYCSRECSHVGRTNTEHKICAICAVPFVVSGHSKTRNETCSDPCRRALQRRNLIARNEQERPSAEREITRKVTKDGYIRLRFPSVEGVRGREVLEHRYNMEQHLGRELFPEETVHHKNGDRSFNDLTNIELFSSRHGPGQRVIDKIAFAIEMAETYPEFLREAGYELVKLEASPVLALFDKVIQN